MSGGSSSFVDLSNQGLKIVPRMGRVRSVNLAGNKFVNVENNEDWSQDLRILNISRNSLRDYSTSRLDRLRVLDVSNNFLTRLAISGPRTLVEIKANANRIVSVSGIDQLTSLETLELGTNLIDDRSFECSLTGLQNLSIVDLSNNHLDTLDAIASSFPRCLQALFVGGNPIAGLAQLCALSAFQKLNAIHIDGIDATKSGSFSPHHMTVFLLFLVPNLYAVGHAKVRPEDLALSRTLFKEDSGGMTSENLLLLLQSEHHEALAKYIKKHCGGGGGRLGMIEGDGPSNGTGQPGNLNVGSASQFLVDVKGTSAGAAQSPISGSKSLAEYMTTKESPQSALEASTRVVKLDVDIKALCAVVALQSVWRGYSDRKHLRDLLTATTAAGKIQSVFRSYNYRRAQLSHLQTGTIASHGDGTSPPDAEGTMVASVVSGDRSEELNSLKRTVVLLSSTVEELREENAGFRAEAEKLKLAMKYLWTEVAALRCHISPRAADEEEEGGS